MGNSASEIQQQRVILDMPSPTKDDNLPLPPMERRAIPREGRGQKQPKPAEEKTATKPEGPGQERGSQRGDEKGTRRGRMDPH